MSFHRIHKLSNGDIFELTKENKSYLLEFEDRLLYEVVVNDLDEFMQPTYRRTGVVFTQEEINNL